MYGPRTRVERGIYDLLLTYLYFWMVIYFFPELKNFQTLTNVLTTNAQMEDSVLMASTVTRVTVRVDLPVHAVRIVSF